jgi:hypothetical protein
MQFQAPHKGAVYEQFESHHCPPADRSPSRVRSRRRA